MIDWPDTEADIGTTTPGGFLDVEAGSAAAATNGSPLKLVGQAAGTGNQNGGDIILMPGAKSGTGASGGVLIGTTSNPGWMSSNSLYVAGNIYVGNAIQAGNGLNFGTSSSKIFSNKGA